MKIFNSRCKSLAVLVVSLTLLFSCHRNETISFVVHSYVDNPYESDTTGLMNGVSFDMNVTLLESDYKKSFVPIINSDLMKMAFGRADGNPDSVIVHFCDSIRTMLKSEMSEVGSFADGRFRWNFDVQLYPEILDKYLVSYACNVSTYMGGAHPTSYSFYYSFDLATGKRIKEQDVFALNDENVQALTTLLRDALENQIATDTLMSESDKETILWDEVGLNGNFRLGETSLTYHFNAYDVAPYAYGPIDIEIPSYKLHDYMRPESPIYKYWFK